MKKSDFPLLASKKKCTGCLVCVDACRIGAISAIIGNDGHLYPKVDLHKCLDCGSCTKYCPIISGFDYHSEKDISQPYAAWANDEGLRIRSSSGGIFPSIAKNIINEGGFVVGAVIDGLSVKHILTNRFQDVSFMQGSKYLQSNPAGVYRTIQNKLENSKTVLFSGLPCQNAALINSLGNSDYFKNLYTIDLVCGGVPSRNLVNQFNKMRNYQLADLISFRNKINGWKSRNYEHSLSYKLTDGTIVENERDNLIIKGFLCGLTNRYSCFACPYAIPNRKSDLTLADFWGIEDFKEQHYNGVSLVITHSEKGEKLLINSNICFQKTSWQKSIPLNPRIVCGERPFHKYHPARYWLSFIFRFFRVDNIKRIYAWGISNKDVIWLPYKLFNFIGNKINVFYNNKALSHFLQKTKNE